MSSIVDLADRVKELPPGTQKIFNRIFSLEVVKGNLNVPPPMMPWVKDRFGRISNVTTQTIIKINNLVTLESSVYNPLRALRPHSFPRCPAAKAKVGREDDPFAMPLEHTAEDLFGRVEGKYCLTASNIAKYAQYHCVVIFNNSDPLAFNCNELADYIETGWKWAQRVHEFDQQACNGMFLWNCTNRAGASIRHGHAQVVLTKGSHYPRVEYLRRAALQYQARYRSDYFNDLFEIHAALGLGWQSGKTKTLVYLTALKQNEVMVLAPSLTRSMTNGIYRVLAAFRDRLEVKSFNLGVVFRRLGGSTGWEEFPVIARMLDRGDTADISSDIGAMEFYGANVVQSNPWETARALIK